MLVITADQIDSRGTSEAAGYMLEHLNGRFGDRLPLPVDRNAGDELQAIAADGGTTMDLIVSLVRDGRWRIGLGIGAIRTPLPGATREASGSAFVAAREAVGLSRRRPTAFAVIAGDPAGGSTAAIVQALADPFIAALQRRSDKGWELSDLLAVGLTRAQAAARLGVSAQAVSSRAASAQLWMDAPARDALAHLLDAPVREGGN